MPSIPNLIVPQIVVGAGVKYSPQGFNMIADKVMPIVPVPTRAFKYRSFSRTTSFTAADGTVATNGGYPVEIDYQASLVDATLSKLAYGKFLADTDLAEAAKQGYGAQLNLQVTDLQILMDQYYVNFEKDVAAQAFTAMASVSGQHGAATNVWSDYSKDTVLADWQTAREACVFPPNVMVVNTKTMRYLQHHPALLDAIKYTARGFVTPEILAGLAFDGAGGQVLVGEMKINSANPGQVESLGYAWGNSCLFAYVDPTLAPDATRTRPSFGYTFVHEDYGSKNGFVLKYDRDNRKDSGGNWQDLWVYRKPVLTATDMAYLITGCY